MGLTWQSHADDGWFWWGSRRWCGGDTDHTKREEDTVAVDTMKVTNLLMPWRLGDRPVRLRLELGDLTERLRLVSLGAAWLSGDRGQQIKWFLWKRRQLSGARRVCSRDRQITSTDTHVSSLTRLFLSAAEIQYKGLMRQDDTDWCAREELFWYALIT